MYDDQPPFGADDRCRASFFGGHPLARSVLGTVASIEALPVESMRDYHRRRYSPGNIVLTATGAVDFPALVDSARRLCGDWQPHAVPERRMPLAAAPSRHVEHIVRPTATLEDAVRMSAGPADADPDRFAAKLLSVVLGDASGSRLYWALVDSGEAEHASCHHHDFLDAGLMITQLSCDAADIDPLLGRIMEVYHDAATKGIGRQEFEQARNKLASRVVLEGERPRRRLFHVGLEWAHSGSYRSVGDNLRIIEGLSIDDLAGVLARWPLDGPAATVLAGPASAAAETSTRPDSRA
jgi:predicted Zn-dependent peptidase